MTTPYKESVASKRARIVKYFQKFSLTSYGWLSYGFLYLPILLVVVFSFNDSRSTGHWVGFTTEWYGEMMADNLVMQALWNSVFVALVSAAISTVIGTLAAMGMERYSFRGRTVMDAVLYLPVVIPDIAMAIMLLLFFNISGIGFDTWKLEIFGFRLSVPWSVIIGHVAFNISFVAIVVRARLSQMDMVLEEAANDLYANPWKTFTKITLPMLMPGIIGGALLAFTLSLDDFVITFFTSGAGFTTLPVRVFGMIKRGITPKINAISTLMLGVSFLMVILSILFRKGGDDESVDLFF